MSPLFLSEVHQRFIQLTPGNRVDELTTHAIRLIHLLAICLVDLSTMHRNGDRPDPLHQSQFLQGPDTSVTKRQVDRPASGVLL